MTADAGNANVGLIFSRLTVKSEYFVLMNDGKRRRHWVCDCECGNETRVSANHAKRGSIRSCGCIRFELKGQPMIRHGRRGTPEYKAWAEMLRRCYRPKCNRYYTHGARGIRVCERWQGLNGFVNFFDDMGSRPTDRHSLDRIDNNGNYEPGNCRWATNEQQVRNSRKAHNLTFDGQTRCIEEWSQIVGIASSLIVWRIGTGWSTEDALTVKPRRFIRKFGPITFQGKTQSISEWAKEFKLKACNLRYRLNSGYSFEDAIRIPFRVLLSSKR